MCVFCGCLESFSQNVEKSVEMGYEEESDESV